MVKKIMSFTIESFSKVLFVCTFFCYFSQSIMAKQSGIVAHKIRGDQMEVMMISNVN